MSATAPDFTIPQGLEPRLLNEGYGAGAWHGPDLKAALGDVPAAVAFWRPAADRHNIAEIALHHAYCVRNVRAKISGATAEPFVLEGDDWFAVPDAHTLSWPAIQSTVESEQRKLSTLVADIEAGRQKSPLTLIEQFDVVLGVACHAIYHAGQVQLLKRLAGE
jgi:hypothetical protein